MTRVVAPLSALDRAIAAVAPRWGLRRAAARQALAYYEAANPGKTRKARREASSGNAAVQRAGTSLREQARHLEQNHDLAMGALNALVANTIGPQGIGVEPQPRMANGDIHVELANQLLELYRDWCKRPEVTWQHDWPAAQRLLARSWFRDGEAFANMVAGSVPFLDHGTRVPLSLELLEADYVPLTLQSTAPVIVQGVEINGWGRVMAYWVYKQHPADVATFINASDVKRVSADTMLQVATRHRIRQVRGVSMFASVLSRLDDLKDYEESERVAAKVAASMAAYIRKGQPDMYAEASDGEPRDMKFRAGMIFDDLRPGEDVGTIDTNRPNPNLETYRSGQLRAVAGAMNLTYSALSHNYNGTYSAQRQELVEGYGAYGILSAEFGARIVRPVYEKFVAMALAAGLVKIPPGLVRETLDDCLLVPPQMPWIDPEKEANANAVLEDRCYASGPELIRRRGANPRDVLAQQAKWLADKEEKGIPSANEVAAPKAAAPASEPVGNAATASFQTAVVALATREPPAPVINFQSGDTHVTLAEGMITTENHVAAPVVNAVMPEQAAPVVNVAAPNVDVHVEAAMPEQAAPEVEVVVNMPDELRMAVTSLPTRATTSSVTRDPNGNITRTTQTETDA